MKEMSNIMRRLARKLNGREDGFTLLEVIVALAILGIISIGIYSALNSSIAHTADQDERADARSLAEAQMEWVKQKGLPYEIDPDGQLVQPPLPDSYDPNPTILGQYSSDYEVTIDAAEARIDLQLITVTIFYYEEEVFTLEGYKFITEYTYFSL